MENSRSEHLNAGSHFSEHVFSQDSVLEASPGRASVWVCVYLFKKIFLFISQKLFIYLAGLGLIAARDLLHFGMDLVPDQDQTQAPAFGHTEF